MARRTCRVLVAVVLGYLAAAAAGHLLVLAGVGAARAAGRDPRQLRSGVRNFRVVDGALWAGGQPNDAGYQALAADGVTAVVDLRRGTFLDPVVDDPVRLASLGIRHVPLPITDGHAPAPGDVDALLAAMPAPPRITFVHCAAGVGRSTSVQMAYCARTGLPHGVFDQLAVGPPSLEQIAYVAGLAEGRPPGPAITYLSRHVVDGPRKVFGWIRRLARRPPAAT